MKCHRCGSRHELDGEYFSAAATALWKTFCPTCAFVHICKLCGEEFIARKDWTDHIYKYHWRRND
jgi:hypothetical protein